LNRLPEVKGFLHQEAPKYSKEQLEVKYTHGDPIAKFFTENGEEVEKIPLASLNKQQIRQLLESKGIFPLPQETPVAA